MDRFFPVSSIYYLGNEEEKQKERERQKRESLAISHSRKKEYTRKILFQMFCTWKIDIRSTYFNRMLVENKIAIKGKIRRLKFVVINII